MNMRSSLFIIMGSLSLAETAYSPARAEEQNLTEMSIAELMGVEISLDDAFNIFDALVEDKKIAVATGRRQGTSRAPAVTSVITAQDIEAMGARTLSEALAGVPGLHVGRDGAYQPIFVLRGLSSENNSETLMLINGEPFKALESGNRGLGWRDMPVQAIQRIEVMRGPGSALYGADAFAGVINIITKTARDIQDTEVGIRGGSYDTYGIWALHGGTYQGWETAVMLEYEQTGGLDTIIQGDSQSTLDRQMGTRASLAPGPLNLGEHAVHAYADLAKANWRLRLGYQGRYDVGAGVGLNNALDPWAQFERNRVNADMIYHNPIFTPYWEVTAQLNYVNDRMRGNDVYFMPPGALGVYSAGMTNDMGTREAHWHAGISGFYSGIQSHLLHVGLGLRYQDLYEVIWRTNYGLGADGNPIVPGNPRVDVSDTPFSLYPEKVRENQYIFLQDTWQLHQDWELTAGLRYDNYSDFGDTLNPRLALVWQVSPEFTSKLMYGHAFRTPSFRELYIRNNRAMQGNPDLKPERVQTWEIAANWRLSNTLNVSLTPFYYQIEDKIFVLPPNETSNLFRYTNAATQKGYGAEFEIRWKINKKSSVLVNYSYASAEINGDKSRRYPEYDMYVRGDWLLYPSWYLDAQWNWIGERGHRPGDPQPDVPSYDTLDLTLRYKKSHQNSWNLAFGVRNLLDHDVREPSSFVRDDLPLAGRHWFVEARYHFD